MRTSLAPQTHLYMGDMQGRPLDAGKVYFGEPNKDPELYPINVFYDEALTIPAPQPIRTMGGFMNANGQMVEIYAAEIEYSVKVLDAYDREVFYQPLLSRSTTTNNLIYESIFGLSRSQSEKNAEMLSINDGLNASTVIDYAVANKKSLDGLGKTVTATLPADFTNLKNIAVKDGGIIYPSPDFFNAETSKITNAPMYTSWAQDKAYTYGNKIICWLNYTDSHVDAQASPCYVMSEDGGASYSPITFIDEKLQGWSTWAAGTDGEYEYVFVRKDDLAAGYPYKIYKRLLQLDENSNMFAAWTITDFVPPRPTWATSTVMLHSFCAANGKIVTAGHGTEGAWLLSSSDKGATWVSHPLLQSSSAEEATVKYDPISGEYMGFMRYGGNGNPRFWKTNGGNLDSISYYSAPTGFFGAQPMGFSPVPLQIVDGVIHAFSSYRSGTLETTNSDLDESVSAFYIKADISKGANIWTNAEVYSMGKLYHVEKGGASALAMGSVVIYQEKMIWFYGGHEERTGQTQGAYAVNAINRISNIYQTVFHMRKTAGIIDYRNKLPTARYNTGLFQRLGDGSGYSAVSGKFHFRRSHTWSFTYCNHQADNPYDDYIFDLAKQTAGGVALLTDVVGVYGFTAQRYSHTSGMTIDTGTYNLRFEADGIECFRWNNTDKRLQPANNKDNVYALGAPLARWSVVYAGTGTINTSDERMKSSFININDAEKAAALKIKAVIGRYQFNDAIALKDDGARYHFGVGAQTVGQIMRDEGLDPERYAFYCHDVWDKKEATLDDKGNVIDEAVEAGDRFGIRYDELAMFILAAI